MKEKRNRIIEGHLFAPEGQSAWDHVKKAF
jgi:hypothetical protein